MAVPETEALLTDLNAWTGPYRPDARFTDPDVLSRSLIRRVLPFVTSPARYIGGELGAVREGFAAERANLLLAFPDAYEVGMSHQGIRILYTLLKQRDDTFCDLAYTPWPDMEERLRGEQMPLFGLESRRPVGDFDVVGFSLGYELAYANMLTMIDLAGSPVLAADRGEGDPIYLAGGSCTLNPAVVGPFLDVIFPGDGEEVVLDVAETVARWKTGGGTRTDLVTRLRALPGAWHDGLSEPVRPRVVADLNRFEPPGQLVPIMEPVHDRLALEVMRGCVRGCRFCQAGMITRPVRERDPAALVDAAAKGIAESGYAEISLLSLSTSDYTGLHETVAGIQDSLAGQRTNLVLPSLRVDSVDEDLYQRISRERPANFTFAPEAGSQRLRDVINKQITEADVVTAAGGALRSGVKGVKLYFMIGLPTETTEDLDELVALVGRVVGVAPRGGSQIHVSISPFAPKAHTPFQWAGQISREEMGRRNTYLDKRLRRLGVKVSLRDPEISYLEGLLGLGDSSLAEVVLKAWQLGARFDGWSETFDFGRWQQAITEAGVDDGAYLTARDPEEPLPWDTVFAGVDKAFLQRDWRRASQARTLTDCRLEGPCYKCAACGTDLTHVAADLRPHELAPVAVATDPGQATLPESPNTESDPDPRAAEAEAFDPRNADPLRPDQEKRKWQVWRQQAAAKCWYRMEFSKTGDMVFLGHLDFQRQLQLALKRSALPAAYSKGYHPHPLLKFGPPLAVGIVGLRENLDIAFEVQEPGWVDALNETLPTGLRIRRAVVVGAQTPPSIDKSVKRFDYRVEVPGSGQGGPPRGEVAAAVEGFLSSPDWPVLRRRPKGDIEIDARALVPTGGLGLLSESAEDGGSVLQLSLLRGDGGATLPVHDFLTALLGDALPEPGLCAITRTGYYGQQSDGRWMTPLEEVGETSLRFWLNRRMNG